MKSPEERSDHGRDKPEAIHALHQFVEDNERLVKDGLRFLSELRAVLRLELQLSKLSLARLVVYGGLMLIFGLSAVVCGNVALVLALTALPGVSLLIAVVGTLALNLFGAVVCFLTFEHNKSIVGVPRTKALIARARVEPSL